MYSLGYQINGRIKLNIGKMIKDAMDNRGIVSLAQLARMTDKYGITYQTVYKTATNQSQSLSTISLIFKVMDYDFKAVPFKGDL